MKVYEALAQAFDAEGVTAVFGMMGDANMYWMTALERHPSVQVYEARFEGAALAMADGWARATGQPGVCAVTCGPGITQLGTSLVVAHRANTPLVVFAGDSPSADEEYIQRMDQQAFATGSEAGFVRLLAADQAYDAVRTAFYRARVEARPIMLDVPMDIQQLDFDRDEPYQPSTLLAPPVRVQPDPDRLRRAVELIAQSRRPVIVAGRGAMLAGARDAILALGDRIGALLATSLMAKNWLAGAEWNAGISGLYASRPAIELFAEADCVIGVGASLNYYTTEHGYVYPEARYVQIDLKPHARMFAGRGADVYLQADARAGVEALERLLAQEGVTLSGYRTPESKARLGQPIDPAVFDVAPDTVDPRQVSALLDEMLPEDVALVVGGGHFVAFPAMHMNRPRLCINTIHFGCIGQGVGTAIGAAAALGKPTLLVDGDASAMMHIQELDTAVRYNLPLLLVVLNDEALGAEYHKLRAHDLNSDLARIATPDLGAIGRAFGGRGCQVRSIEQLAGAVREFLAQPGPMVVDARVSRSVVSVPYRRLHFGEEA